MKLYHNPRCSKSRETLKLLTDNGVDFETILYLETPPSAKEIADICQKLAISPEELVRKNEKEFKSLTIDLAKADWLKIMANTPKLMQRPILVTDKKAAIGRPPENVLAIL